MCASLTAAQLEKYKEETRETDVRREQSLQQFKEWFEKHPFISNFNMGGLEEEEEKK
jgi:mannose/fructose/N-acetylgalactosamine-specific phosphotransferase system component IID